MANTNLTIANSLNAFAAQGRFAVAGKLVGMSMPPASSSPGTGTIKRFEERNPIGDYDHPHRVGRSVVTITTTVRITPRCCQERLSQSQHQLQLQHLELQRLWQSSNDLTTTWRCN